MDARRSPWCKSGFVVDLVNYNYVIPRWLSLTNPISNPNPNPLPYTRTQRLVAGH